MSRQRESLSSICFIHEAIICCTTNYRFDLAVYGALCLLDIVLVSTAFIKIYRFLKVLTPSRVSSRIFCLGGKNSLEFLTTPTFVGTLYWHVNNFGRKIEGLGGSFPPAPPSR